MKHDVKLLTKVMSIQTYTREEKAMAEFILRHAGQYGYKVEHKKGSYIYLTKGEAELYPCAVAHIDTVHRIAKNTRVFTSQGHMFAMNIGAKGLKQKGIGGDDKTGVYICLNLLRQLPILKVALFYEEESGTVGSGRADLEFFDDCAYMVQFDRRGRSDVITKTYAGDLCSQEFADEFAELWASYDFKPATGSLTDVVTLRRRGVELSAINLSAGYYEPHTDKEYIVIADVFRTEKMAYEMFSRPLRRFKCKVKPAHQPRGKYALGGAYGRSYWDDDDALHQPYGKAMASHTPAMSESGYYEEIKKVYKLVKWGKSYPLVGAKVAAQTLAGNPPRHYTNPSPLGYMLTCPHCAGYSTLRYIDTDLVFKRYSCERCKKGSSCVDVNIYERIVSTRPSVK